MATTTTDEVMQFDLPLYELELGRKDAINGELAQPTKVLAHLTGGLSFLLGHLPGSAHPGARKVVMIQLLVAAALAAAALILLARAKWGHKYELIPDPGRLESYRVRAAAVLQNRALAATVKGNIIKALGDATAQNRASNNCKTRYSMLANASLIAAMVAPVRQWCRSVFWELSN